MAHSAGLRIDMLEDIAARAHQEILANGGVTINLQGHEPTQGYAYSPFPELERIYPSNVTPQVIAQYLSDNEQALSMPGNYLGAWHDQQSGNVFLDVSHVGPPTADTVAEAKKANQLAVFDLANFNEIPTGLERSRDVTSAWQFTSNQDVLNANWGQPLQGLPNKPVNVPGHGPLQFGPHRDIQRVANEYNQMNGLGAHPADYVKVNPQHAQAIAQEYERMPHNPNDPTVKAAYDALANEVRAQYDHAVRNGYQFEFYPDHDPYPNSPREAVLDLHHNKRMYVYPTDTGYGMGEDTANHPLLADSGVRWGGRPVTHNDLFRAIHDFYGHAKEGVGFRHDGEDNAYRQHAAMFSPLAQRALASETRGQNSWVNFGPHGEHNQTATSDTVYAPQKAGLMPEWTSNPDLHRTSSFKRSEWQWPVDDIEHLDFDFPTHPKFETTEDDIRAAWAAGHRVEPHVIEPPEWRWSKADPEWLSDWIAANGPYMAHSSPAIPLIKQYGLLPHDTEGIGSKYKDDLVPRANHVYLRHPGGRPINGVDNVYVDLRKLDPRRINSDEDPWFDLPHREWEPHLSKPFQRYKVGDDGRNQYSHVEDGHGRKFKHFGHWADEMGLNEPHHVVHSLNHYGTVAVEGGVNPEAFADPEEVEQWYRDQGMYSPTSFGSMAVRSAQPVPYEKPVVPHIKPFVTADQRAQEKAQQDWQTVTGDKPMDPRFEREWRPNPTLFTNAHSYTREDSTRQNLTVEDDGVWQVVAWNLPDGYGVLGPQTPEEFGLQMHEPVRVKECPNCHWLGKWSTVCPRCGFEDWARISALPFQDFMPGYFHAAPTSERARIQAHGLQPSDPYHNPMYRENMEKQVDWHGEHVRQMFRDQMRPGLYLAPTLQMAQEHGDLWHGAHDIWYVPHHKMDNPQTDLDYKSLGEEAYYTEQPVLDPVLHTKWEDRVWPHIQKQRQDAKAWGLVWPDEYEDAARVNRMYGSEGSSQPTNTDSESGAETVPEVSETVLTDCQSPPAEQPLTHEDDRLTVSPADELRRSLGLDTHVSISKTPANIHSNHGVKHSSSQGVSVSDTPWDEAWTYGEGDVSVMAQPFTVSRPSFKEFLTSWSIRESKKRAADQSSNFSNIRPEVSWDWIRSPNGTDGWDSTRFANTVTLYHNAPTVDRARIMTHGLIPSVPRRNPVWEMKGEGYMVEDQPEGIYLSKTPTVFHNAPKGQGVDLYAVEVDPSKLVKDPVHPSAVYHSEPILPEQIKMHRAYEGGPEHWRPWPKTTSSDHLSENQENGWDPSKFSMAADPYWLDHWMERNGPYLYHATQDPAHLNSILKNGLLPWDHPENPQGQAHGGGSLQPRPGHVYLKPFTPRRQQDRTVRVDIRKLDPNLMNPDEDNMVGQTPWNFPAHGPNQSGGDWAEHWEMNEPSQTAWSLDNPDRAGVPALAYRGVIPPHAIDLPDFEPVAPGEELRGMAVPRVGNGTPDGNPPEGTPEDAEDAAFGNRDKFFTSETQHERRKRNWLEWIWKRSVAEPEWVKDWIEKNGPYMYHGTTREAVPKIKSEGLFPHDHLGTNESIWKCPNCNYTQNEAPNSWEVDHTGATACPQCHDDYLKEQPAHSNSEYANTYWEPRQGHVYLGTKNYVGHYTNKSNSALLRVDLRKLDPTFFSADEDHWHPHNPYLNSQHLAVASVHEENHPPSIDEHRDGGETLGQWADNIRLGQKPEETHYSMGMGSMAYNGHIPAEAIEHVSPYNHEPYSYDENGEPYVDLTKKSKETPGQIARRWGQLLEEYPDNTKVLHQTPEGYTIRHLPTFGDISRTGLHMLNCWRGLASYSDQSREVDPWHVHQRYTLNDEKGHPQVAFFIKHPQHGRDTYEIQEPLGPRNKAPMPEYEQALRNWAQNEGYEYKQADYENPLLHEGKEDPRVKPQKCKECKEPAIKSLVWAEGMAYVPVCAKHEGPMRKHLKEQDGEGAFQEVAIKKEAAIPTDIFTCAHCGQHAMTEPRQLGNQWNQTCTNCGRSRNISGTHPLIQSLEKMQPEYPAMLQEIGPDRPMTMNYF